MHELIISKTQKADLSSIVAMENESENSQFIVPNTKDEYYKLMIDKNIEHLILKSENDETIIGFVILAG
jgi:hypothetical protein